MSMGRTSDVSWVFMVLTLIPAAQFSTQYGGHVSGAWAPSVVKELTSDDRNEACCQPGGIEGAYSDWM